MTIEKILVIILFILGLIIYKIAQIGRKNKLRKRINETKPKISKPIPEIIIRQKSRY